MQTRPTDRRESEKKAYQAPVLTTYGTVWELTRKVGTTGTPDHGHFFRTRTHA